MQNSGAIGGADERKRVLAAVVEKCFPLCVAFSFTEILLPIIVFGFWVSGRKGREVAVIAF